MCHHTTTELEIGNLDEFLFYRHDPFGNTLRILNDPKNNRTLYLIGTTNSSTMLA